MKPCLSNRILSVILKVFFNLLYHRFAWLYDAVAWLVSFGRWQSWILAPLPYLTNDPVLEIGHGPGHLQLALYENQKKTYGLDESRQMCRMAYERLSRCGYQPCIVNGYAQYLPFPSDSFGHVVATFPSEYIFSPKTLSEIYRVLSSGGALVVLPTALILGSGWFDRLLIWLNHLTRQTPPSLNNLWLEDLSRPFRQAGFDTTTITPEINNSRIVLILAQKPSLPGIESPPLT